MSLAKYFQTFVAEPKRKFEAVLRGKAQNTFGEFIPQVISNGSHRMNSGQVYDPVTEARPAVEDG